MTDLLTDIHLEDRDSRPAVSIPIEATLAEWGRVNALLPELLGWMPEHGARPVGPPFYQHHRVGGVDDPFSVSVGFELTAAVAGDDRVQATTIAPGRYLIGTHNGHPDQISGSHQALLGYAREHGLRVLPGPDGDGFAGLYETYLTDPNRQPDPDEWVTEIAYRIE